MLRSLSLTFLLVLSSETLAIHPSIGFSGRSHWKGSVHLAQAPNVTTFPASNFTQKRDHFADNDTETFQQQYWVSKRHYQPGGPVIMFDAGEGPGNERMPILDTGIIDILAAVTNGLGVVLEHRYYGAYAFQKG